MNNKIENQLSFNQSGNLVALKTRINQVIIHDLENPDNEKVIECDSSINTFTINDKDNFLAIVLENSTIMLYDITLARNIKNHSEMKFFPFKIIFIHLGALWLGDLTPNNDQLMFNIQQINDFSQMTCSTKNEFFDSTITKYHVNRDILLCVFKSHNDQINKIIQYQLLDSRGIKQRKCFEIKTKSIEMIRCNWNNSLIIFVTDNVGLINLIDGDHIIEYKIPTKWPIKSIAFDMIHHFSFCMSTNKTYHFCFYSQEKGTCYRHDSSTVTSKHEDSLMIAYKIPYLYVLKENSILVMKNKHLMSYQNNKQEIENMICADNSQFMKSLYDCKIENANLWRVMAKKCTIERDIDAALICAAKMGDAGLVRFLKQEMATKNGKNIACFLMMLHLDLIEESEELIEEIDKSQLGKLYSLQERWTEAFECADKIELKNLYYQYGKQMEMENRILDAIVYYEQSGNISHVIRMLFENENIADLKNYCLKKKDEKVDKYLVSWWGQYCESQGDHSSAIEMYRMADDYYNLVRILCHLGQVEQAIEFVDNYSIPNQVLSESKLQSEMTGTILFLGKHLESIDSMKSIEYYLQCSAIRHAFRVCIDHEHFDKLVEIAVQYFSPNEARNILKMYFPNPNDYIDKMVNEENMAMLYYKSNLTKEAILFSIKHRLWNYLRNILSQELEKDQRNFIIEQKDMDLILEYLREDASIIDIVIDLILMSDQKNFDSIAEIIHQFGIDLSDGLMAKLETFISKHHNQALMNTIAELCLEKGNYHLAAKLYNKIGKRVDSIKALIRTGQTDKIIQFANVARDKKVFKLAGNFLQTINYEDTKQVIKFYTKAEAHEELTRYRDMLTSINQS